MCQCGPHLCKKKIHLIFLNLVQLSEIFGLVLVILTNNSRFKIDEDSTGYVLASSGLAEESVERIVSTPDGLVCGHLAIRLDAVLQAVKLPAGITDLDSGLANVYRDALTLCK